MRALSEASVHQGLFLSSIPSFSLMKKELKIGST